jgi:hypothetical protein
MLEILLVLWYEAWWPWVQDISLGECSMHCESSLEDVAHLGHFASMAWKKST